MMRNLKTAGKQVVPQVCFVRSLSWRTQSCTRQAKFRASIDGVMTTATCNAQGADPSERCQGCCQARALAAGLTTIDSAGFPSNNGRECICCFFNSCR
ncbi:hypothetical protein ANCCEY_05571 [Ancylostoma ceylanicum]|uniref:Uncharacterized protein n=1 Tax=Ancylostoma ceylanicum TaxID=53326 RepID=A0A0D6M657_9BILA|nr:hypothetical protein ANCCEY_05571 [Ancylostoma ceylanicum]